MGWILFKDVIAYSRNVATPGRPQARAHHARRPRTCCTGRGRRTASGSAPASTSRASTSASPRPGDPAVAAHRPRQSVVRPVRGGDPGPAGDRLHAHDQRRHACPAALPGGHRRRRATRPGVASRSPRRSPAPCRASCTTSSALYRGTPSRRSSRATRWAARRARRRSGIPSATATAQHRSTSASSATWAATSLPWWWRCASARPTPRSRARQAQAQHHLVRPVQPGGP